MRTGSLCSGYNAFALALNDEIAWHAEIDKAAIAVHETHWPDVPNLGDIKEVDWTKAEEVDLLTAGYPCQPFSTAGLRKGTDDHRHLWPFVNEAVRHLRPRHVFLENVPGHRSKGFGVVLGDLAQDGYDVRWCSVRASDVGAPHRRERVFILARLVGVEVPDPDESGPQGPQPTQRCDLPAGRCEPSADAPDHGLDGSGEAWRRRGRSEHRRRHASHPDCERQSGWAQLHGQQEDAQPKRGDRDDAHGLGDFAWGKYEAGVRRWERLTRPAPWPSETGTKGQQRLSPKFVEWMMGLPDGHVTDVGLPHTAQLRVLGNGIVPQAARMAWDILNDPLPNER